MEKNIQYTKNYIYKKVVILTSADFLNLGSTWSMVAFNSCIRGTATLWSAVFFSVSDFFITSISFFSSSDSFSFVLFVRM